jgi:transposase
MKERELLEALEHLQQAHSQLQRENDQLRQENTQLRHVVADLMERIKQLEAQAAKDSHNSSKPPSSNGFKEPVRKTKSLRGKSGKKSGGQAGHPGHTLLLVEQPDQTLVLAPHRCQICQQDLLEAQTQRVERFQVVDLPRLALQVREYQAQVKVCPACQGETRAALPEGLLPATVQYGPQIKALAVYLSLFQLLPVARVSQVLSDLFDTSFSQASVLAACRESAQRVAPVLEQIKTALQHSQVLHNDETGFRVLVKRWWLHVACTPWYTLYLAHPTRGDQALKTMGILPGYAGTSVHDSLSMYLSYPCTHALCVAHYLRELSFVHEQYQQSWAPPMQRLLRSIHLQVEQARAQGLDHIREQDQQDYRRYYRHLVAVGLAANPPPTQRQGQRGAIKKGDVLTLLLRLQQHEDLILRFMTNFAVPFTNNQAENDLRMMKLHQKISGCFRTSEGSAVFCAVRSYLSTMAKQGVHLLSALASTCSGPLLLPPLLGAE